MLSMLTFSCKRWLAVLLFVFLSTHAGFTQSSNATITGVVSDPAAAVVPGAEVKLTNTATGTMTSLTTSTDGMFSFPNLQQATYDLQVAAKGFRDFVQKEKRTFRRYWWSGWSRFLWPCSSA